MKKCSFPKTLIKFIDLSYTFHYAVIVVGRYTCFTNYHHVKFDFVTFSLTHSSFCRSWTRRTWLFWHYLFEIFKGDRKKATNKLLYKFNQSSSINQFIELIIRNISCL